MLAQAQPRNRLSGERKAETIRAGDFVYCRSKRYRDSLQLPAELGVVIEIKRASHKILYASDRRAWVPRELLVRMDPPSDAPDYLRTLNFLLRCVDAHESEVTWTDDLHLISAQIDRIDHATFDSLREYLGPRFVSATVVPEGMAFMQIQIVFRS
jgi:hypothetical protein